jgi:hypothetical protein
MGTFAAVAAYCPHCFLEVDAHASPPWPATLARCPHCRLTIGQGRARTTPADASPGSRGTAAGVLAHEARTADRAPEPGSRDRVRDGIRAVARRTGARPERLLMIDYQQRAVDDTNLPSLEDVFAAFGSWKQARRESALA